MNAYEREIKRRMLAKILFCTIGGIAVLIAIVIKLCITDSTEGVNGFSMSMLIGMFGGIVISSIPAILKYRRALKDKESLETLRINEKDERNQMVEQKTCRTCFYVALTLLGFGALIAGIFSKIVFFTLGYTLIALIIIYVIVKIIYVRHSY